MGEIVASVALENTADRNIASAGLRGEATIRRTTVKGVVDAGAVMLVLAENVARAPNPAPGCRELCGRTQGNPPGRRPVTIRIGNRFMVAECEDRQGRLRHPAARRKSRCSPALFVGLWPASVLSATLQPVCRLKRFAPSGEFGHSARFPSFTA